jgi:hypothetical protein
MSPLRGKSKTEQKIDAIRDGQDLDDVVIEEPTGEEFEMVIGGSFGEDGEVDPDSITVEDIDQEFVGQAPPQLTERQAAEMAKKAIAEIDKNDQFIPVMPLNLANLCVWALENTFIGEEPGIIVTIANTAFPRGIPFVLDRDRGLKFCSQLKKRLMEGPPIEERAAQAGLSIPQQAPPGELIIPGR